MICLRCANRANGKRSGTVEQAVQGFDINGCSGVEGAPLGDCSRQVPHSGEDTAKARTSCFAPPVTDGVTHDAPL